MDNADLEYLYFLAERAGKYTDDTFCTTWLDHLKEHLQYLAMKERPLEAVQIDTFYTVQ